MQAPIRLERMLPHIVALGVGRLAIVGANKVRMMSRAEAARVGNKVSASGGDEDGGGCYRPTDRRRVREGDPSTPPCGLQVERSYWGSHLFRRPVRVECPFNASATRKATPLRSRHHLNPHPPDCSNGCRRLCARSSRRGSLRFGCAWIRQTTAPLTDWPGLTDAGGRHGGARGDRRAAAQGEGLAWKRRRSPPCLCFFFSSWKQTIPFPTQHAEVSRGRLGPALAAARRPHHPRHRPPLPRGRRIRPGPAPPPPRLAPPRKTAAIAIGKEGGCCPCPRPFACAAGRGAGERVGRE